MNLVCVLVQNLQSSKVQDSPYGEVWNYSRNKEGILKFWEDGLSRVKGQTISQP